ncbi:hypothetical protein ACERK3_19375 [Phycisphaerales bacterium AB-hyl4]|uniref:N-acetyltransferase domain-containing protein n=1 Tax=Natronomicrosphaera hydrolytica TaxID=3242702 RepID=A0ABV4UBR0_9BACT
MQLHQKTFVERHDSGHKEWVDIVEITPDIARDHLDTWWNANQFRMDWDKETADVDYYWSWHHLASNEFSGPGFKQVATRDASGDVQSAIIYRRKASSLLEKGHFGVFVERLAIAPSNRPWVVTNPRFRGCGSCLLHYAIRDSNLLGFGGRALLIPTGSIAKNTYRSMGFRSTGVDEGSGSEIWELPPEVARDILKGAKEQGFFYDA